MLKCQSTDPFQVSSWQADHGLCLPSPSYEFGSERSLLGRRGAFWIEDETLGSEALDGTECSKVSAALTRGMSPHRAGEFRGSAAHRDHCTFLSSSHGRGTLGSRGIWEMTPWRLQTDQAQSRLWYGLQRQEESPCSPRSWGGFWQMKKSSDLAELK